MPVLNCQHCGGPYELPEEDADAVVICPHCEKETGQESSGGEQSAASLLAQQFTDRIVDRSAPQRMSPLFWVLPVSGLVVTILAHVIAAALHIKWKPLPDIAVFWIPAALGTLAGPYIFSMQVKSQGVICPKWALPVALAIALALSAPTMLLTKKQYISRVRTQLKAQVNERLNPPHLPPQLAACQMCSIPERAEDGTYSFAALLTKKRKQTLGADVRLLNATLIDDQRIVDMQSKILRPYILKGLNTCLAGYPHLRRLKKTQMDFKATGQAGTYQGALTFDTGLKLNFKAILRKTDVLCRLEPESDTRARSIPLATKLWKDFDPETKVSVTDITLGKAIDDTHREATAVLSGDIPPLPVILEQTPVKDKQDKIVLYFQTREATILEINRALKESEDADGGVIARRCVSIDKKRLLRDQEYWLRALFPEGDPMIVLAREEGYTVSVVTEEHLVMVSANTAGSGNGNKNTDWSILIPAHYSTESNREFVRERKSDADKLTITMETKQISAYSKFSLREYAVKERQEWLQNHPAVDCTDVESWSTRSGLSGLRYVTTKGAALRIKYFFVRDSRLCVLSAVTTESDAASEGKADTIVATLRYKDLVGENTRAK